MVLAKRVTLILVVGLMLASGCCHRITSVAKANWTVMVYMNAKNELECAALDNLSQMDVAADQHDVNVLVELGRPKQNWPCHAPAWSGVRRFRVQAGVGPGKGIRLPDTDPEGNMGRGTTLAQFVLWSMQNYPAQHYMLIVWGHGQGFRYELNRRHVAQNAIVQPETIGGVKSVSYDPDFKRYLFTRDLADSLGDVLHGRMLDIIGFDSCLMAGIENAYGLRRVAKFMVGSEEVIPDAGWNYSELLWRLIAAGASSEPRLVGWMLVESYRNEYRTQQGLSTLSALDLGRVEAVAANLSKLAEALRRRVDQRPVVDDLLRVRGIMCNYGMSFGYTNPVDLQLFLEGLASSGQGSEDVQSLTATLLGDLRAFVIAHHASPTSAGMDFGSHGISIYFPPALGRLNNDPHDDNGYAKEICSLPAQFPVEFVCKERWSDFLVAYLHAIPSLASASPTCPSF